MAKQDFRAKHNRLDPEDRDPENLEKYIVWLPIIKLLKGPLFWVSLITMALLAILIGVLSASGYQPSTWWEQKLAGIGLVTLCFSMIFAFGGFLIRRIR